MFKVRIADKLKFQFRRNFSSHTKELLDGIAQGHPLWQEKILFTERHSVAEVPIRPELTVDKVMLQVK